VTNELAGLREEAETYRVAIAAMSVGSDEDREAACEVLLQGYRVARSYLGFAQDSELRFPDLQAVQRRDADAVTRERVQARVLQLLDRVPLPNQPSEDDAGPGMMPQYIEDPYAQSTRPARVTHPQKTTASIPLDAPPSDVVTHMGEPIHTNGEWLTSGDSAALGTPHIDPWNNWVDNFVRPKIRAWLATDDNVRINKAAVKKLRQLGISGATFAMAASVSVTSFEKAFRDATGYNDTEALTQFGLHCMRLAEALGNANTPDDALQGLIVDLREQISVLKAENDELRKKVGTPPSTLRELFKDGFGKKLGEEAATTIATWARPMGLATVMGVFTAVGLTNAIVSDDEARSLEQCFATYIQVAAEHEETSLRLGAGGVERR
jgi:hypothetical protein